MKTVYVLLPDYNYEGYGPPEAVCFHRPTEQEIFEYLKPRYTAEKRSHRYKQSKKLTHGIMSVFGIQFDLVSGLLKNQIWWRLCNGISCTTNETKRTYQSAKVVAG